MQEDIKSIIREELKPLADFMKLLPSSNSNLEIVLDNFVKEYERYIECNYSEKYLESVRLTFKHFLKFLSPARTLNTITSKDIESFLTWLRKRAPRGYDVYFRNLKAALNKAVEWNYIINNPCSKVKLPKKQVTTPPFISEDELMTICEKIGNETICDIVKTAFYTGLRLNELINLKWKNIELKNKLLKVGDEEFVTKSRKQRTVPLHDKVYNILKERYDAGKNKKYVFAKSNNHRYTGDCASRTFKRACREAGIDEKITFHCLRHSYASFLVQKGVSIYVIKDLLGHSSMVVTERYSHLNTDALREAVSKFN